MAAEGSTGGFVLTSGRFTSEAQAFSAAGISSLSTERGSTG
jgi:hypothetical protein